jgi:hypothetical protein
MSVGNDEAGLVVTSPEGPQGSRQVRMKVHAGELVAVGAELYRVVKIVCVGTGTTGGTTMVGAPSGSVVIDARPVRLPQVKVHQGSLMIPWGATATMAGFDIEATPAPVSSGDRPGAAQLQVWPADFAKPDTKPEHIKTYTAAAGAKFTAGSRQLEVLAIVAPDSPSGVQGFVEVGG